MYPTGADLTRMVSEDWARMKAYQESKWGINLPIARAVLYSNANRS